MRRPTAREAALRICSEYVKEVQASMNNPQARWRNIDLACFVARAEAIEEIAKRIAKMEVGQ